MNQSSTLIVLHRQSITIVHQQRATGRQINESTFAKLLMCCSADDVAAGLSFRSSFCFLNCIDLNVAFRMSKTLCESFLSHLIEGLFLPLESNNVSELTNAIIRATQC
jgi:hypothetical protein